MGSKIKIIGCIQEQGMRSLKREVISQKDLSAFEIRIHQNILNTNMLLSFYLE